MSENQKQKKQSRVFSAFQSYVFTGILTVIPIIVTIFIIEFVFNLLSGFGDPLVEPVANSVREINPVLADVLNQSVFRYFFAILLVLILLVVIGWISTRVIGRRIIRLFDSLMNRIPMVSAIYGSMKKLLDTLQQKPEDVQRVVLIDFPSDGRKAVGLVTTTFFDKVTGENTAVVFVPMSPNPTGGFLELVPVSKLVSTNWTIDEAMTFIVSGGAVPPKNLADYQMDIKKDDILNPNAPPAHPAPDSAEEETESNSEK